MMRHTNAWDQLWEQLRESTEGPTVTLQVPREVADQLLAMLATSLEVDGDGEPDEDDFGGPPDGDGDDMPFPMGGDEGEGFPGLGDGPDDSDGEDSDDTDDDDDDSDDEEDDDEEDDTDEAADYAHSGGNPSGLRTQTALGEGYLGFKKLKGKLAGKSSVRDPGALAAAIGRKKYGAKAMAAKSAAGRRR